MSSYAEPTAAQVHCPACQKAGRPSLHPGYRDLYLGERVTRAACTAHRHPVVGREYTGTAKSSWGTVGAGSPGFGHGPVAETETETETETVTPTPAELDRAEREALAEMRAGDGAEA